MDNEQVALETKGVTVRLLATVDLGIEIEGMAGHRVHAAGNDSGRGDFSRYRQARIDSGGAAV